jgi:FKBP-type peptidyl-prolyl cis-trans isomerase FklB
MQRRWQALLLTLSASLCLGPGSAWAQQPPAPAPGALPAQQPTFEQDVSYSIGLSVGRDLLENRVPVDPKQLVAGIMDALSKTKPRLSDEQVAATMTRFEQQMQQKAEARMASAGEKNKATGAAFLAENAKKEGIQTTASGLQYRVVKQGTGASPNANSTVSCHYEGTLLNGEIFDSSFKRGEPAEFPVNRVIAGWTEVLQLMKEGGSVEVFIPSDLAYGDRGAPPAIGPGETLVFKIDLQKVK